MAQEIILPSGVTGTRVPLGSLEEMQARAVAAQQAATAQQAAAAQLSQAQNLTRARLSGLPVPEALPMGAPNIPAIQSQLGQLSGIGTGSGVPAIEAPATQAGAVNAARYGQFSSRAMTNVPTNMGIANDIAALRGAPGVAPGVAPGGGLAGDVAALRGGAGAGAASEGGGLLSSLAGRYGLEGGVRGAGGLGGYLGGGLMGAAKTAGARLGAGTVYSLAPTALGMGVEAFGPQIEEQLGLAKGSTKGTAQAGADVGTGALLGTLIAPGPGTLIGAALGGAKNIVPLASELAGDISGSGVAQQWGKATDQFNKMISRTKAGNVGKSGVKYLNDNYFAAAKEIERQAHAGEISHDAAVQGMRKLTTMMQKDISTLRDNHGTSSSSKKKATALQIQMGDAMARLSEDSRVQGAAAQATLNNLAMDPNMAAIAPILQASGQMRNQWGNTMADAYTGQAYMEIPQQRLDAKLAELRQLNQQIQAAQNANGGGSSSLSDLAAQVK